MNYIQTSQNSRSSAVKLFYQDVGSGQPVLFIHGWPLSSEMWEYQLNELPKHGLRCIAYDRRGFGKSDKPWDGYDYDTFADDLNSVIQGLGLSQVVLVGFSMGGGEVARYFKRYSGDRVAKVILLGSVTPYLLKTNDNEDGVDQDIFDDMLKKIKEDRADFLNSFGKQFFGVNFISHPVSQSMLNWNLQLALAASPKATLDCVTAFSQTDFRKDVPLIKVPTLIIHGDSDQVVPLESSGKKTAELLPNAEYVVYNGAPHGFYYTEKDRLNADLVSFIKAGRVETRENAESMRDIDEYNVPPAII